MRRAEGSKFNKKDAECCVQEGMRKKLAHTRPVRLDVKDARDIWWPQGCTAARALEPRGSSGAQRLRATLRKSRKCEGTQAFCFSLAGSLAFDHVAVP